MNRYCIMMVIVVASWTHAARSDVLLVPSEYATIQSAIVASSDGDTILVAPGRYYEAINMLGKAVQLLGAQGQASTFIDATDLQSSVITCSRGEGPDTIIRRFTITGGTGTFENGRWNGAGMYISGASPTVQDCTFSVNEVAGFIGDGGGMYNFRSDPIVDNCTFYRNVAFRGFGGGMCNIRSNPTVTGCRFEQNLSEFEGGGMYDQDSHPTVEDCTFIENFSSVGSGGGMTNVRSSPSVTQCDFIRNASMGLCGGMDNLSQSSPLVIDCLFEENTCEFGSVGGMRNNDDSNPTIVGCLFTGNEARRMGGAMLNWQSSPVIIDCEFIRNRAESGGAINNFLSNASVTNCVFERNRAVWGAALLSGGASSGRIVNCSFVANVASSEGGGIRDFDSGIEISNCILWENVPEQIRVSGKMDPVVRFCDIEGGYEGEGNIDQNPQFVDSGGGDFRLRARSPCIDAGDNAAVPEGIERDLDGNVRRMDDPNASDTGRGDCPIVDMGAFEVQSEGGCCLRSPRWQCDGDVDGDGQVNPVDSGLVQASFGSTDETDLCRYDVDCDGQINPVDSGIVQSLFGTCEAPRNVCP